MTAYSQLDDALLIGHDVRIALDTLDNALFYASSEACDPKLRGSISLLCAVAKEKFEKMCSGVEKVMMAVRDVEPKPAPAVVAKKTARRRKRK